MTADERKAVARNKIRIGELAIKAGLGETEDAVLLGALLDTSDRLTSERYRRKMEKRGQSAMDG